MLARIAKHIVLRLLHVLRQDHVVAGVKLTKHDTFLPRAEFMQLVYACCSPARPGLTDAGDFVLPPPAIWKPQPLWTGKQVAFCTPGAPPSRSAKFCFPAARRTHCPCLSF